MQELCPSRGYVRLYEDTGTGKNGKRNHRRVGTMPTTCKTWSCRVCQKKLKAYFSQRVRHAVLTEPPCYFITVTFRNWSKGYRDARSAMESLTKLLRKVKERYPAMFYVKVPELTKAGQPHFHLMIGGLGIRIDCCGRKQKGKHIHEFSFKWAGRKCGCLEHELAFEWVDITMDSYRVQVDMVYNAKGAGNYLSKYFAKTFEDHKACEAAGFSRRYSFSRNYPKLDKLGLQGTREGAWSKVERIDRPAAHWRRNMLAKEVEETEKAKEELMAPVGERYLQDERKINQLKRLMIKVGGENVNASA